MRHGYYGLARAFHALPTSAWQGCSPHLMQFSCEIGARPSPAPAAGRGAPSGGRGAPSGGRAPSYATAGGRGGPSGGRGSGAPHGGHSAAPSSAPRAPAAPPPAPLPVPTEDFNFEEQNAKFKKEELVKVRTASRGRLQGRKCRSGRRNCRSTECVPRLTRCIVQLTASAALPVLSTCLATYP